jgi:hypothetical protein
VTAAHCLVASATSAVVSVQECDGDGGNCVATAIASGTCANTTTSMTIANADVDPGDWLRIDVGAISGIPSHVAVCVTFQ